MSTKPILIVRIPIDSILLTDSSEVVKFFSTHSVSDEYHIIIIRDTRGEVMFEVFSSEGVPPLDIESLKTELYEIFTDSDIIDTV